MEELLHFSSLPAESTDLSKTLRYLISQKELSFNNGKGKRQGKKKQKANLVKCKCPNTICSQLHSIKQCHLDQPMGFCASTGPILVTLHLEEISDTFRADAHQFLYQLYFDLLLKENSFSAFHLMLIFFWQAFLLSQYM